MADARPLRLLLYDDTCRGRSPLVPGLTHSWIAGWFLYRGLGRLDRAQGARSWEEGLRWLATVEPGRAIEQIQFWGHGKWGNARIDGEKLDVSALWPGHEYHHLLATIRDRLVGPDALWWFRTCETFGAEAGQRFAREWTDFFNCRAAGHTYIIGPWQSGLHCLRPGEVPDWSVWEGIDEGTPEEPVKALWSTANAPNTLSCLGNSHPVLEKE
jgi:hypothetical protein